MPVKIERPGVYDISEADYHADCCPEPSLSSSIGRTLIDDCPAMAWWEHPRLNPAYEPEEAQKFDLGSAAHALTLGDELAFHVVDADDWRTKDAKAERDKARAEGKIPLLTSQWERVVAMVEAGKDQLSKLEGGNPFVRGRAEQTLVWCEDGIWLRARLDYLLDDHARDDRFIFAEFKSTELSTNPDNLTRLIYNLGYDFQLAFYRRGVRALGLHADPAFALYFQQTTAPYLVSPPIRLTPHALEYAERKVETAITLWRRCVHKKDWPAHPRHICYIDPPPWIEAQFEERDARDRASAEDLARAAAAQAPLHDPETGEIR